MPDVGLLMDTEAPAEEPVAAPTEETEEYLSDEEQMYAEDLGFDEDKALALKGFIKSCMAGGEY